MIQPLMATAGYVSFAHFLLYFVFLIVDGREDPNTTKSGPWSAHQRNALAFCWRADEGTTLNAGLVALWSGPVLLRNLQLCDFSGDGSGPPTPFPSPSSYWAHVPNLLRLNEVLWVIIIYDTIDQLYLFSHFFQFKRLWPCQTFLKNVTQRKPYFRVNQLKWHNQDSWLATETR